MISNRKRIRRMHCLGLAVPAALAWTSAAFAQNLGTNAEGVNQIAVSVSGSTALKNWLVGKSTTFTDINPSDPRLAGSGSLSINGVTYPLAAPNADDGANYWADGGNSYQLAPKSNAAIHATNGIANQDNAIVFSYHESGSVEGVYELANDQIAPIPYVTANIDRNPEGGSAVWVNYNQIGASGTSVVTVFNATTGAAPAGSTVTLGNFYGTGVGQAGTPGETSLWVPGSASNPVGTFTNVDGEGINTHGGQNAVQVGMSDAPATGFQERLRKYQQCLHGPERHRPYRYRLRQHLVQRQCARYGIWRGQYSASGGPSAGHGRFSSELPVSVGIEHAGGGD